MAHQVKLVTVNDISFSTLQLEQELAEATGGPPQPPGDGGPPQPPGGGGPPQPPLRPW